MKFLTGVAQLAEHRSDKPEVTRFESRPPYLKGAQAAKPYQFKWRFEAEWGRWLGRPECPYVRRWLLWLGAFSVRIHHFVASDDPRALHDHPWWYLTVILKGGYTDVTDSGGVHLRAPAVAFRHASHRHTVQIDPGGVWTLLITGPQLRYWGFWVKGRFKKANKYFAEHGTHPCQ